MVFDLLLDRALAGCGTTRAVEEDSALFRRRLELEATNFAKGAPQSALLSMLRLQSGLLREGAKAREPLLARINEHCSPLPRQELRKRVWLRHLGYLLAKRAADFLPQAVRSKFGPGWRQLDDFSRQTVLKELASSLKDSEAEICWAVDRLRSTPEMVLPVHYAEVTPCCLGKAQLVAGAAYLAKVPALLGVVPVQMSDHQAEHWADVAECFNDFLESNPIVQSDFSTRKGLYLNRARYRSEALAPSWMHAFSILRDGKNLWTADPNFQFYGRYYLFGGFQEKDYANWNRRRPGAPLQSAMSVAHAYRYASEKFQERRALAEELSAIVAVHLEASDAALLAAVCDFLRTRTLLEAFAKYLKIDEIKPDIDALLAERMLCMHAGVPWEQVRFASREQIEVLRPRNGLLRLLCRRLPFVLLYERYSNFEAMASEHRQQHPFPLIENYPAHFALGVYTLRHIAACEGMLTEFALEMLHYCAGQFLLWDCVCSLEQGPTTNTALAALMFLSELEPTWRLKSANRGIGAFLDRLPYTNAPTEQEVFSDVPRPECDEPESGSEPAPALTGSREADARLRQNA